MRKYQRKRHKKKHPEMVTNPDAFLYKDFNYLFLNQSIMSNPQ